MFEDLKLENLYFILLLFLCFFAHYCVDSYYNEFNIFTLITNIWSRAWDKNSMAHQSLDVQQTNIENCNYYYSCKDTHNAMHKDWNLIDGFTVVYLVILHGGPMQQQIEDIECNKNFRVEISRLLEKKSHQEMGIIFFRKESQRSYDTRNTIRYGQFVQGSIKDLSRTLIFITINDFFIWLDFCAQWQKEINQGYQIKFHKRTKNHLFG